MLSFPDLSIHLMTNHLILRNTISPNEILNIFMKNSRVNIQSVNAINVTLLSAGRDWYFIVIFNLNAISAYFFGKKIS